MNSLVVLFALVAAVVGSPQFRPAPTRPRPVSPIGNLQNVAIVRQASDVGLDSYQYSYETENGIAAQEQGQLRNAGVKDAEEMVAQGSFSYTGDDGVLYTVTYTADGNGFQAQGAHLPTPPPIPEAIQKALAYIASQPAQPQAPRPAGGRNPFGRK